MLKQLRKRSEGFTIIEVVIVLAIAGLILLVVFLAVPSLQRNSRNNQYKTEANNISAAVQEFIGNNSNTAPVCGTYPCTTGDIATILGNANTKKITTLTLQTPGQTATALAPDFTSAILEAGVKCGPIGGTNVTATTTNATPSNMILVYAIETSSGGKNAQCSQF